MIEVFVYVNHSAVFDRVKQAYENTGETVQNIAVRLDVHYVTIHKWARKYNWVRRGEGSGNPQAVTGDALAGLKLAYEADFSREVPEIAASFGVSGEAVRRYARKFGWKRRHNSAYNRTATHKQCLDCDEWLPKSDFRRGGVCNLCIRAKKYGTTKAMILELFDKQGGKCAVCGKDFSGRWCVDHDHNTGDVRGILCDKCNTAIGLLGDDPKRLMSAAKYLVS